LKKLVKTRTRKKTIEDHRKYLEVRPEKVFECSLRTEGRISPEKIPTQEKERRRFCACVNPGLPCFENMHRISVEKSH